MRVRSSPRPAGWGGTWERAGRAKTKRREGLCRRRETCPYRSLPPHLSLSTLRAPFSSFAPFVLAPPNHQPPSKHTPWLTVSGEGVGTRPQRRERAPASQEGLRAVASGVPPSSPLCATWLVCCCPPGGGQGTATRRRGCLETVGGWPPALLCPTPPHDVSRRPARGRSPPRPHHPRWASPPTLPIRATTWTRGASWRRLSPV